MYRIAICDDNQQICTQLERIILNYGKEEGVLLTVDIFYTGERLLKYLKKYEYYDMIFLDIELPAQNGVSVAIEIRDYLKLESTQIVFISYQRNYAMDLFQVRPFSFLIKPLENTQIVTVLKKGMALANARDDTFLYKSCYEVKKCLFRDILYFESNGRMINMVTIYGFETFYGTLSDIYNRLIGWEFFYCSKSCIVNYGHIKEFYYKELVLSNQTILTISQGRRKAIREMQLQMIEKETKRWNKN